MNDITEVMLVVNTDKSLLSTILTSKGLST
jgi:hypothetical protein